MKMKVIIQRSFAQQWSDPLMNYIYRHIEVLQLPENRDIINDIDTLFSYINHLVEEFVLSNPSYKKPTALSISYLQPSCCPPSIHISYKTEKIEIKESFLTPDLKLKDHEKFV